MASISADDLKSGYESAADLKASYEGQQPKPTADPKADALARYEKGRGGFMGLRIPVASPSWAVPGGLGVQAAAQPIIAAAETAAGGNTDPGSLLKSAAGAEAGVLGGGMLGKGLELVRNAPLFRKATQEAVDQAAAKTGFDKAMTDSLNTLEQRGYKADVQKIRNDFAEKLRGERAAYKTGKQATMQNYEKQLAEQAGKHEAAVGAHANQSAESIAGRMTDTVSAWKDYPKDTRGLLDMVYGKGQADLSKNFDTAMKEVAEKAAGQSINIPIKAANSLGLKALPGSGSGLSPVARRALEAAGRLKPMDEGFVTVDAAQAAKASVGAWAKDTGAYRAVVNALDRAGIGDPKARAEYSAGQALINFFDKTKALEGETFHPDRVLRGFTALSKVNELRRRGMGNIFEGPMQAARGVPGAPAEIPKPIIPPFIPPPRPNIPQPPLPRATPAPTLPTTPGFKTIQNPIAGHPWTAGAAAEALSAGAGLGHGYGIPFLLGMTASQQLPKQLVTQAPGVPGLTGPAAAGSVGLLKALGVIP